jgi:D-serine deaminase-like pyridoxal phosphate-dependent protein
MTTLDDLPTPSLVIDLDRLESNIGRMAEKARRLGVSLRPHIKTHKCVEIAQLQREAGCQGLTVSTLYEARVFADHGFTDLTWAFPLILNRIAETRELARRARLRLVVDSAAAIDLLEAQGMPFHIWLKVDCGYHRAGVDPESQLAFDLADRIQQSTSLKFDGLLTHSGHAYQARTRSDVAAVAEQERATMDRLANALRARGLTVPEISVGSTPAMSVVEDLTGIDEVRPGNYVFFDQMQVDLGACEPLDCAVTVLASVVSSQPGADHCVVDAGALALSKDSGSGHGRPSGMGAIFDDYPKGQLSEAAHLRSLSQEHGILSRRLPIGERIRILPQHACLTVACFDHCFAVRGHRVEGRWQIWNGR